MILSIGIDIVEVYRIREAIDRTPRFAERVFTNVEREYCKEKGAVAFQSFAGRFAAKEAFLKALGTGWRGKLKWTEIEVVNNEDGVPALNLSGEAGRIIAELRATDIHLSIAHTKEHAIAQIIIEKRGASG